MLKAQYFNSSAYSQSTPTLTANILNPTLIAPSSSLNPLVSPFIPKNAGDLSLLLTPHTGAIDTNHNKNSITIRKKLKDNKTKTSSNKSKHQKKSQRLSTFHFTDQRQHAPSHQHLNYSLGNQESNNQETQTYLLTPHPITKISDAHCDIISKHRRILLL